MFLLAILGLRGICITFQWPVAAGRRETTMATSLVTTVKANTNIMILLLKCMLHPDSISYIHTAIGLRPDYLGSARRRYVHLVISYAIKSRRSV
ncbi:hypothetical protein F5J12DRAFT_845165 [Pisolithus orientalis]|uniref:uncharacterized protein n=1 Tax=Pisolithus orientalis TaxID=936130 RepID=UPI00222563B4|nr:uncharacterized protein F5J12DRAFT_845165 [Pisolithus orientalis]KAI6000297.1 hypothetical protein F5J12DRAFT_845165 [Pisolithus orientalis]